MISQPLPGSPFFENVGKMFDYYGGQPVEIAAMKQKTERIPKEVIYIPAILFFALVWLIQRRRRDSMPV